MMFGTLRDAAQYYFRLAASAFTRRMFDLRLKPFAAAEAATAVEGQTAVEGA